VMYLGIPFFLSFLHYCIGMFWKIQALNVIFPGGQVCMNCYFYYLWMPTPTVSTDPRGIHAYMYLISAPSFSLSL
jgi:hypothetical protein